MGLFPLIFLVLWVFTVTSCNIWMYVCFAAAPPTGALPWFIGKWPHLNWDEIDQKVCLNMVKKDQLCAIALMTKK